MFAGLLHLQDLPCCDLLLSSLLPEHVATQICEIDDVRALSHVGAHDNPRTTPAPPYALIELAFIEETLLDRAAARSSCRGERQKI
jgi:hypothetical protein